MHARLYVETFKVEEIPELLANVKDPMDEKAPRPDCTAELSLSSWPFLFGFDVNRLLRTFPNPIISHFSRAEHFELI